MITAAGLVAIALVAVVVLIMSIPDIQRYKKIRNM